MYLELRNDVEGVLFAESCAGRRPEQSNPLASGYACSEKSMPRKAFRNSKKCTLRKEGKHCMSIREHVRRALRALAVGTIMALCMCAILFAIYYLLS